MLFATGCGLTFGAVQALYTACCFTDISFMGSLKNPGETRSYSSAAPGPSLRSARAKRRRGERKGSSLFLSGGEAIIILH